MPSFDKVCENVFSEKDFLRKFLIGGALTMIPILSVVYFVEVSRQMKLQKKVVLPDWENYLEFWKTGSKGVVLFVAYFGAPWLVGLLLSEFVSFITFGGLGLVHYFPLLLLISMAPAFYACSLYILVRGASWKQLFDLKSIFYTLLSFKERLILPTLIFWGLMFLGAPFYGFAFFLGFLIYLLYIQIILMVNERKS